MGKNIIFFIPFVFPVKSPDGLAFESSNMIVPFHYPLFGNPSLKKVLRLKAYFECATNPAELPKSL